MPRGCWVQQRTQKKGQEAERGHEIWSPSCLGILCLGPAVPPLSSGPLASAITSFLLLLCQLGFLGVWSLISSILFLPSGVLEHQSWVGEQEEG